MRMKRFISLLLTLLFVISLLSIISSVNAAYDEAWDEGDWYESHKEWFQYYTFNATIIAKDSAGSDYRAYLVKVNDEIFYIRPSLKPANYYIGDKITIYGNAINEERNRPMSGWSGNDKYHGERFPFIRLGYKPNTPSIQLAESVREGSSSNSNSQQSDMEILKSTITNGNPKYDQTNCTVYVDRKSVV